MIFKTINDETTNGKTKIVPNSGFVDLFKKQKLFSPSDIEAIKTYNVQVANGVTSQNELMKTMKYASTEAQTFVRNANGGTIALDSLTTSSKAAAIGMQALSTVLNVGIAFAISVAISGIYKLATYQQTLADSASEAGLKLKESADNIADYKTKIEELQNTINDSSSSYVDVTQARKDLMTIQDEMIDKYGDEKGAIDNITDAIKGQVNELDKLKATDYNSIINDFNTFKDKSLGDKAVGHIENFFTGKTNYGADALSNGGRQLQYKI